MKLLRPRTGEPISHAADDAQLSWRPLVLNPACTQDAAALAALVEQGRVWQIHDSLHAQLRDLARTRQPQRTLTEHEADAAAEALLAGEAADRYGRWVFYPWSGRLVHTLPPCEFDALRLDRNRHKITAREQGQLQQLTVGVVGLSVGNAVALTLAQEGTCGQLKLADFDCLDMSNMNRLRARIDEVGLPKSVLAARQIYELNPYARVCLFSAGLTADNVQDFLTGEPALDIVIDECDSIQMKFLLREGARALRRPVLMETSDRGMVDVERFDLEPQRPLFHGLVGSVTSAELGQLNREERLRVILRIVDPASLSTRMAASLIEVDRTLSTWPQLASEVALGGASMTAAVRRLGLGQPLPSGRTYLDLDALLGGREPATWSPGPGASAAEPASQPSTAQAREVPELAGFLVEHALLAPSGANAQPWQFYYGDDTLWVVHDRTRSRTLLDGRTTLDHPSLLALGAAIENVAVAAAYRDYRTHVQTFPRPADPSIVAAVRFARGAGPEERELAKAFPQLRTRVTNRRVAVRRPLEPGVELTLLELARSRAAHLQLVSEPEALAEVGRILGEADRLRFVCRELHQELVDEVRWTPADAARTRDGIELASLELTAAQAAMLRLLARPDVAAFLRSNDLGSAIAELAHTSIAAASAVGLLTLPSHAPEAWLQGGRAMQRVWLAATALGIALQPMTAVLFMRELLEGGPAGVYTCEERAVLRNLQVGLDRVFAAHSGLPRALLFRLAYAPEPTQRSVRRPVERVLHAGCPPGHAVAPAPGYRMEARA